MNMDFMALIKTVAPWIGTALGGPLGGMAVEAAANALGVSTKTADALKTALAGATPEQMLALKTADQDFAIKMQQLGFDHEDKIAALAVDNTKDARNMQVQTRSWVPATISVVIVIGFLGVLVGMMFDALHADDNQAMLLMLGSLGTGFGLVLNFWLGSTNESGRKTELLANSSPVVK